MLQLAVGYALSVLHPAGAGLLGGGGFAIIYIANKKEIATLDFREMVSESATPDKYLDSKGNVTKDKTLGYRAGPHLAQWQVLMRCLRVIEQGSFQL